MPRLCSSLLLSLLIASSASAVTMAWTPIGNPGNVCDPQSQGCFGAVAYSYSIGTYEVTNSQYAEFLNAKAADDPFGLWDPDMSSSQGGITRSGTPGGFSYGVIAGREDMPVNAVSFYDGMRFANWMSNGQASGDTEIGSYTITAQGIDNNSIVRNANATIVLPTENEWYKAAYYAYSSASYFDYPARSNTQTLCDYPTAIANRAACGGVPDVMPKGSYTGSASPYGTFDQGGNVFEWNETIIAVTHRGLRGGSFPTDASDLAASFRGDEHPFLDYLNVGFRLVLVPEPSTGLLVIAGLVGFAVRRRIRG
jgi:formylglycine-generating enzyme